MNEAINANPSGHKLKEPASSTLAIRASNAREREKKLMTKIEVEDFKGADGFVDINSTLF